MAVLSYDGVEIRYVLPVCGWRHIFIPWDQWPESSTTLCLEEVHQVVVPAGRQTTTVFGGVHQNAALGVKSDIYH